MKSVHLVIPDLFLPKDYAAEVCAELRLPALEKLLGKGRSEILEAVPLENLLCELFAVPVRNDAPIAALSAACDGLAAGCWLRADPVNLDLQRTRLLLGEVPVREVEAATLCASLNGHFAGQGMQFFAPHPQRWYVRIDTLPDMQTTPLSAVIGADVRKALPSGADAPRWHRLFNEIQMLLYAHPLNDAREARGEPAINSLWFWGAGVAPVAAQQNFQCTSSDEVLAQMLAAAAAVPFSAWRERWRDQECAGRQLLVWSGLRAPLRHGDLAAWRSALQDFEISYAMPLWQALRSGEIGQLRLDIAGMDSLCRVSLTRRDAWAFWRGSGQLAGYSLV